MGSREGQEKAQNKLKQEHGFTSDGKSIFHQNIGRKGGGNHGSNYFARLKHDDPKLLDEISSRGGKSKATKKVNAEETFKYGLNSSEA